MKRPDLSKLARDYNNFHNSLREMGYSHLEMGVVYTGLGLGMFAPVALTRYFAMPPTDSPVLDALCWTASVVLNTMSSAVMKGVPLVYTGEAGALFLGFPPAFTLKKWRQGRRERKQEKSLEGRD